MKAEVLQVQRHVYAISMESREEVRKLMEALDAALDNMDPCGPALKHRGPILDFMGVLEEVSR